MKKRWRIGILFIIIVMTAIGVFVLKYNELKPSESSDVVKISENLYYKNSDENKVIYDEDIGRIVSNELIIYVKDIDKNAVAQVIKEEGGKIIGYIDATNTYQIEFEGSLIAEDLQIKKNNLEKNEFIEEISYNYVMPAQSYSAFYPNDENWKEHWENMEAGNWGLKAMNVPEAWNYIENIKDDLNKISIGVLEIGILDITHGDLKENLGDIIGGASEKDKGAAAHGTQVAGIIGAGYNNKCGITGIMMNNGKINYFSYNRAKENKLDTTMAYLTGLTFLIASCGKEETAVVNASFGYDIYQVAGMMNVECAINEAKNLNRAIATHLRKLLSNGFDFLIVHAAGNSSNTPFLRVDADEKDEKTFCQYVRYVDKKDENYKELSYLYKKYKKELSERIYQGDVDAETDIFSGITDEEIKSRIIVVGGLDKPKENNYPLYMNSSKGNRIDIGAPATHVESTTFGNCYAQDLDGTSFAAPYISGIAGLMLTVNPDLSGEELKKLLIETGTGKYNFGMNGEIHEVPLADAYRAVEKAENYGKGGRVFENLPGQFEFSSGVGGWMTKLELNSDGSFTGQYYDADMGDVGAKYPKGTAYICNFTGCFTEPKQIDAYTYSMQLESLELEKMPGEIYYEDNVKYICRSPYGFDNANEFMIYLPGSEISELPQGFLQWIYYQYGENESVKTLPFYGIYNVDGESGFLEDK